MDYIAILALIEKAVGVISTAISVGASALPAIQVIENLVTGGQTGTVTADQLTAEEATLDAMIADFNQPIV